MAQSDSNPSKERCEGIGNIAICLYYLSSRARASNMEDLAQLIEHTISRAVDLGTEGYREYLKSALGQKETSDREFIKNFCPVNDETVQLDLLEILSRGQIKGMAGSR